MTDSSPFYSVVICTYNRAHLVARAVSSILGQTEGDFELLVVDDGSTDETPQTMSRFKDPRVHYYRREENLGVSACTNFGLARAGGLYITFLNDDDLFHPEFLARMKEHLHDRQPSFSWCGVLEYRSGLLSRELFVECPEQEKNLEFRQARAASIGLGFGFVIERDLMASLGGMDETLRTAEDLEFFIRLVQEPVSWSPLNEFLVEVHLQDDRLTQYREARADALEYIEEKHAGFLQRNSTIAGAVLFQKCLYLVECGARQRARRTLWPEVFQSRWALTLFVSNELRHSMLGRLLLKLYRRLFVPQILTHEFPTYPQAPNPDSHPGPSAAHPN